MSIWTSSGHFTEKWTSNLRSHIADNTQLRQRQPRQVQLIGHRRGLRRTDSCEPGEIGLRCVQYLAKDGVFDDSELKGFLSDLAAMRRADLG
jgi:hypothetical protein